MRQNVLVRTKKDAQVVVALWWDSEVVVASYEVVGDPGEVLFVDGWVPDVDVLDEVEL